MKNKIAFFIGLTCILTLAISARYFGLWQDQVQTKNTPLELSWELLAPFDKTNKKTLKSLKVFNKKLVKVPGFIVPLNNNEKVIAGFLLTPNSQAFIHSPPPSANLSIYVQLKKGVDFTTLSNPSWVIGQFFIQSSRHRLGESQFKIIAEQVLPYKQP